MVTDREKITRALDFIKSIREDSPGLNELTVFDTIADILKSDESEVVETETVDIEGWKGKSGIEVFEVKEGYNVVEHRKDKETGDTYENEHLIPKENVRALWELIRSRCEPGTDYKYKYLVRMVLTYYNFHEAEGQKIETFIDAFNGGQWRAKYFFPYLYYPLKILDKKGYIIYYGRGGIQRISDDLLL